MLISFYKLLRLACSIPAFLEQRRRICVARKARAQILAAQSVNRRTRAREAAHTV